MSQSRRRKSSTDHRNFLMSLNRDWYDTDGNSKEGSKIFYRTPRAVYLKVNFSRVKSTKRSRRVKSTKRSRRVKSTKRSRR